MLLYEWSFFSEDKNASFVLNSTKKSGNQAILTLYGVDLNNKKEAVYEQANLKRTQTFGGSNGEL